MYETSIIGINFLSYYKTNKDIIIIGETHNFNNIKSNKEHMDIYEFIYKNFRDDDIEILLEIPINFNHRDIKKNIMSKNINDIYDNFDKSIIKFVDIRFNYIDIKENFYRNGNLKLINFNDFLFKYFYNYQQIINDIFNNYSFDIDTKRNTLELINSEYIFIKNLYQPIIDKFIISFGTKKSLYDFTNYTKDIKINVCGKEHDNFITSIRKIWCYVTDIFIVNCINISKSSKVIILVGQKHALLLNDIYKKSRLKTYVSKKSNCITIKSKNENNESLICRKLKIDDEVKLKINKLIST